MTRPLVLYVDDDEANRVVFRHAFGSDINLKVVSSGAEALAVLESEPVGVVCTDMRMPGMTGNQLLTVVKERYPAVVRVILTAYGDLEPILRAVNEGLVARYLVKPWKPAEVLETLRWACEAHSLGQRESALQTRLLQTERLAMLGGVVSAVMHDVAQPVGVMHNDTIRLVELSEALDGWARELDASNVSDAARAALQELLEELGELSQDLRDGSRMASEVVARLPALLGVGSGERVLSADPLPVVRSAMALCRKDIHLTSGKLSYDGPDVLPHVAMTTADLFQVLINLLRNAAQAVAELEQGRGRVEVVASSDGHVKIAVRDNGPGMTAQVVARSMEEFFTTRPHGTGLGLAQCRRIVEGCGGKLQIETTPGEGTTVTVTLALAPSS